MPLASAGKQKTYTLIAAADEVTAAFQQLRVASQPGDDAAAPAPAARAAIDLCSSSEGTDADDGTSSSSASSDAGIVAQPELRAAPGNQAGSLSKLEQPTASASSHSTSPLFELPTTAAQGVSAAVTQQSNAFTLGSRGEFSLRAAVSSKLYAHQLEGLKWLHSLKAGGILGDDMGLGKVSHLCLLHKHACSCAAPMSGNSEAKT